jgi:hypothetical protein
MFLVCFCWVQCLLPLFDVRYCLLLNYCLVSTQFDLFMKCLNMSQYTWNLRVSIGFVLPIFLVLCTHLYDLYGLRVQVKLASGRILQPGRYGSSGS